MHGVCNYLVTVPYLPERNHAVLWRYLAMTKLMSVLLGGRLDRLVSPGFVRSFRYTLRGLGTRSCSTYALRLYLARLTITIHSFLFRLVITVAGRRDEILN